MSDLKQAPLDDGARHLLSMALRNFEPHWREALQRRHELWKSSARRDALAGADDRFDLGPLEEFLSSAEEQSSESEEVFLDKVRREDYSAADLFIELFAAQEAFLAAIRDVTDDKSAEARAVEYWAEGRIQDLFLRLLEETSCVYESMAESGKRGYCQVDIDGRIVFANRGLRELAEVDDLRGRPFSDLFGEGAGTILGQIRNIDGKQAQALQLKLQVGDGSSIPVLVEFAPIAENRGASGAYVAITDLSAIQRPYREAQRKIFERASFGIMQVDRQGRLLYANEAMLELMGVASIEGWTLEDIPTIRKQREQLLKRFRERRMEGESDAYEMTIWRKNDRREIPVSVVAIPELGEHNEIVGAFAIAHSRELESAARGMHKSIETSKSVEELLEAAAKHIGELLDYDYMSMYIFSRDGVFSRPIFTKKAGEGESQLVTRWYQSNESTREWLNHNEEWVVEDIEEFLIRMGDEEMLKHPDVQRILEEGVRYWYNQPIVLRGRQVAGISLGSREPRSLARASEVMKSLPLAEAARMVFQLLESQEQKSVISLLRALHASKTAGQAASILTRELANQFQWDNVSIFQMDDAKEHLVLLQQDKGPGPTGFRHAPQMNLPLEGTVAAKACETGGVCFVNNIRADEAFVPESIGANTQSVLCLPVSVGGATPWVLQIEDCQGMAFVQEDIEALERIFQEVRSILNDMAEHYRLRHVFENASDAIITCRNNGEIVDVNGPAVALFDMSKGELEGRNVKDLFAAPRDAENILATSSVREALHAKKPDGASWRVMVTSFRIPEGLDRNVMIVQDLATYKRLAELKKIRSLFGELAHQTRAPIALMQGALRRLSPDADAETIRKFVQKGQAYLHKLELTLRQVFDQPLRGEGQSVRPLLIRVDQMLKDRILDMLPPADRESIDVDIPDDLPLLHVDAYRTDFVFATVLGHYLRFVPVDEKIRLKAAKVGKSVEITIAATLPDVIPVHSRDADAKEFAARFTFENPMVRQYVEDLGGNFEEPTPPGNMTCAVRLPCARSQA